VPSLVGPLTPDDDARLTYLAQHPRRVDTASVGILATMLAEQRRVEDALGSTPLIGPVTDELGRIVEVVREAHGPVRPQVVDVAAQWAQFAGWLNTSAGRPGVAEAWFDRAVVWATEAGNSDLTSTVLSFKGHLAWTYGDVGPMVGLTEAARRITGVYPGERAYDALQAARGHAVAGDRLAAEDDVARSRDLEASAREYQQPIPPWHYYRDASFFHLERGRVWRHLGDVDGYPRRAIDELAAGLASLGQVSYTASYRLDLAAAHVADGNLVAARVVVGDVDRIAAATGSTRLATAVRRMRSRIG
jgi:hypothetical protein